MRKEVSGHSRPQGGFSLGEVLTTLAVIGISLSLAVPGLDQAARSNVRAAAINELVGTLHVARSEALTRNATVAICPSADGAACARVSWDRGWIRFIDDNGNFRADDGEVVLGAVPGSAGFEIRSTAFDTALAFGPGGRVSAPGAGPSSGDFLFCAGPADDSPRVLVLPVLGHPVLAGQRVDGRPATCAPG